MKSLFPILAHRSRRGTAMILALLVVVASTFVLAGWATVLATRSIFSEEFTEAQKRRLALQNARHMGLQWARQGLASNSVQNVSATVAGGWGWFTATTNANATNMMFDGNATSTNSINHFGPMGIGGFAVMRNATLSGSGFTNSQNYYFRSRSPLYGGYPLTAQTNASNGATNFAGLSVATNGMALMFADSPSTSFASAATAYNAAGNRTVVVSPGSGTLAPVTRFPFTPIASVPSGTNTAFAGSLTTAPARTITINGLEAGVDTAYGNGNITVFDQRRSPTDGEGQFRRLGNLPAGKTVQQLSISRNPPLLVVGDPPSTGGSLGYQQADANTVRISHYGRNTWIRITFAGATQYSTTSATSGFTTFAAGNYVRLQSQDSNVSQFAKPMTATGITLNDGSGNRTVIFALANDQLAVVRSNSLTFNGSAGAYSSGIDGAALYLRAQYQQSGGVSFLLMSPQVATTAYNAQTRLNPTNFRFRAIVDGFPLIQLIPATTYTFRDQSNVDLVRFASTASEKFQLRAGSGNETLIHVTQDEFAGDSSMQWRKVLLVGNAANTLNVENSSSAITFSYLEDGQFGVAMDTNSNSTRPLYMSVAGRSGVSDTATYITGGGNRTWRLGATFRDSPATFGLSSNITLTGGIRSNRNVVVTGNRTVILQTQSSTTTTEEQFADRVGWIETWRP